MEVGNGEKQSNVIEMKNCDDSNCSRNEDNDLPTVEKGVVLSENEQCLADEKDLLTATNEKAVAIESVDEGVDTAHGWVVVAAAFVNCV